MLFVLNLLSVWTKSGWTKIGHGRKPNGRKQDWTKTGLDEKLWTKTSWTKTGWTKTGCTIFMFFFSFDPVPHTFSTPATRLGHPFMVQQGDMKQKVWLLCITCMWSRAVAIMI